MNLNIPILIYYQVSEKPHPNFLDYRVTPKTSKSQMKALKALGFATITFNQLIAYRDDPKEFADTCLKLLKDSQLCSEIGFRARSEIIKYYNKIMSSE